MVLFKYYISFIDAAVPTRQKELVTIYDGNLNGDDFRNTRIVSRKTMSMRTNHFKSQWINQQRPRSVNNFNIDIFTFLGRRGLDER